MKTFTQEEAQQMWLALDNINAHVWDRAGQGREPDKGYILAQIETTLEDATDDMDDTDL